MDGIIYDVYKPSLFENSVSVHEKSKYPLLPLLSFKGGGLDNCLTAILPLLLSRQQHLLTSTILVLCYRNATALKTAG